MNVTQVRGPPRVTLAVGIDVGGTKIAAGLVDVANGRVLERDAGGDAARTGWSVRCSRNARLSRRPLVRGGCPSDSGCASWSTSTDARASAETVDWLDLDVAAAIEAPRVVLESDVRAAALAEAALRLRFGPLTVPFRDRRDRRERLPGHRRVAPTWAGAGRRSRSARHRSRRLRAARPSRVRPASTGPKTCSPTRSHAGLVDAAVAELAGVLAVLANALDPTAHRARRRSRHRARLSRCAWRRRCGRCSRIRRALRSRSPASELGADAGIVGAALRAAGDG